MSKQTLDAMARELMLHLERLSQRFLLSQETSELSRSELAVLRFLGDHGSSTMTDISSALGMAHSSATGLIDSLVARRLVERRRPAEDRRQVVVEMTRGGRRTHDGFLEQKAAMGVAMLEPLTPEERERLLALFRKMAPDE